MKKTLVALFALAGMACAADIIDSAIWTINAPAEESFDLSGLTSSTSNGQFSYTFSLNEAGLNMLKTYVGSKKTIVGSPSLISMIGQNTAEKFGVGMGFSSSSDGTIVKAAPFLAITDAGTGVATSNYRTAGDANNYWMGQNQEATDAFMTLQGVSFTLTSSKGQASGTGTTLYTTLAYGLPGSEPSYYSVLPGVGADPKSNQFDGGLKWGDFQLGELHINTTYVDKVLVYGSTLSEADALASNKAIFTYTPEPATATLSLLALAGLAARRRRH